MPMPSLMVGPGEGANRTQVAGGAGFGDWFNYRRFKFCRQWPQITGANATVTEEFWAYAATPANTDVVMGAVWAPDDVPGAGVFGMSKGKWYVRQVGMPWTEYRGDGGIKASPLVRCQAGHRLFRARRLGNLISPRRDGGRNGVYSGRHLARHRDADPPGPVGTARRGSMKSRASVSGRMGTAMIRGSSTSTTFPCGSSIMARTDRLTKRSEAYELTRRCPLPKGEGTDLLGRQHGRCPTRREK